MAAERSASRLARALPLVFAAASRANYVRTDLGVVEYWAEEWTFVYSSGRGGDAIAVAVAANDADPRECPIEHWQYWAEATPIANWRVDSDLAQEIAVERGAVLTTPGSGAGGAGIMSLRMGTVDSAQVPLWIVPHGFRGETRCVRADTGYTALLTSAQPEGFTTDPPDDHPGAFDDGRNSDVAFDAFVSYRRQDQPWIEHILLPKLRSWNIKYAVDFAHFRPGAHFETEMSRLVRKSRWTIVVLTKHWATSPFTEFEADASSGRLIVIRVDDCNLPTLPGGSTVIDLKRFAAETEWDRLRTILGTSTPEPTNPVPVYMVLSFLRADSSRRAASGTQYQYVASIEIENHTGVTFAFDGVVLTLLTPPPAHLSHHHADLVRVVIDGNRAAVATTSEFAAQRVPARLQPNKGMRVPNIEFGETAATVAGHRVVELCVTLTLQGSPNSDPCYCAVPPLSRLRVDRPLSVSCRLEGELPMPSQITASGMRGQVFHSARSYAKDALLHSLEARRLAVVSEGSGFDDSASCSAYDWTCVFSSQARDCTFEITLADPGWIDQERINWGCLRTNTWLTEQHLEETRVDARLAFLIATQSGGRALDQLRDQRASSIDFSSVFALVVRKLGDRWRCLWIQPLCLSTGQQLAVTADTGEVCVSEHGEGWTLLNGSIWNQYSAPGG